MESFESFENEGIHEPRPSNPALEAMELAGVSPQWLTQWRFQYREDAETLVHE